jgi:putative transposase
MHPTHSRWHHAPVHWTTEAGAYIVTAGTYRKERLFDGPDRLDMLTDTLLMLAEQYGWSLHAWSVFSNHYHFVALSPDNPGSLQPFIRHLHSVSARAVNALDGRPGRRVWHQYWDTLLTRESSYLARLNYVHHNPCKHGLVESAEAYRWRSARWLTEHSDEVFAARVRAMKTDLVRIEDDF